jgi:pyrroloquinoline quinone (PQQ) biosynthesis protein C
VKVVVYRKIPLKEVERRYPVIERKQDYRYLEYQTALDHLDKYEADPLWDEYPQTKEKMKQTKEKILQQLGT